MAPRQLTALEGALTALRAAVAPVTFPLPIAAAAEQQRAVGEITSQLDDYVLPRLATIDAPLLAVVGGSTGAGKSTLVNSLVGRRGDREREGDGGDGGAQRGERTLQGGQLPGGHASSSCSVPSGRYSPGGFQVGSTSEYWVAVCPSGTVAATGTPGGRAGTPTGGAGSGAG